MPIINDQKALEVLKDDYFDHHVAMHLCREGLIANPKDECSCCNEMMRVGTPGSGTEFLDMHHEMIRVFQFLRDKAGSTYAPLKWDLDDPQKLPAEIINLFSKVDPHYLQDVFQSVSARFQKADCSSKNNDIDDLGIFIERGDHPMKPDGFHNTLHEYLGSKEGGFARGAEMSKLRNSMNNDYFWSLHLWIDGWYERVVAKCGGPWSKEPLDPTSTDCYTAKDHHSPKGKSHAARA